MFDIGRPEAISRVVDLHRRIHRVVDFIDENLDAALTLENLADIACISPHHFHRTYSRVVGQSPTDTIRRLRLLRATTAMTMHGISISDAMASAGFSTRQAFARAYQRELGRNPLELRMMGLLGPIAKRTPRDFTIVERTPQRMLAIAYEGIRGPMDALTVDTQVYAQHLNRLRTSEIYLVYHDDLMTPYDRPFRCDLCFRAEIREMLPRTQHFSETIIAGGHYACVEQRGRLFDLAPHWRRLVDQQLPSFGWRVRNLPVVRMCLSDRAVTPPSQRLGYLYIPVERIDD